MLRILLAYRPLGLHEARAFSLTVKCPGRPGLTPVTRPRHTSVVAAVFCREPGAWRRSRADSAHRAFGRGAAATVAPLTRGCRSSVGVDDASPWSRRGGPGGSSANSIFVFPASCLPGAGLRRSGEVWNRSGRPARWGSPRGDCIGRGGHRPTDVGASLPILTPRRWPMFRGPGRRPADSGHSRSCAAVPPGA